MKNIIYICKPGKENQINAQNKLFKMGYGWHRSEYEVLLEATSNIKYVAYFCYKDRMISYLARYTLKEILEYIHDDYYNDYQIINTNGLMETE